MVALRPSNWRTVATDIVVAMAAIGDGFRRTNKFETVWRRDAEAEEEEEEEEESYFCLHDRASFTLND